MTLPVPDAALVVAGVAGNMGKRVATADAPPRAADHNRKLALIVELLGDARANDWP